MNEHGYLYSLADPEHCYFSPVMTAENGAKLAGYRLAFRVWKAYTRGEPEVEVKFPEEMQGPVFTHEDGSFDTGLRAIINSGRLALGHEAKIYSRTMRPI